LVKINFTVVAEDYPCLILVKGYLGLINDFFPAGRVIVKQTINTLIPDDCLGDNFRDIFRLYLKVAYFLWVHNDQRPLLAKTVTSRASQVHLLLQALFLDLLLEGTANLLTGIRMAAST
jgi:hypothetical protein